MTVTGFETRRTGRPAPHWRRSVLLLAMATAAVHAQQQPRSYSFIAAQERLTTTSSGLTAARAGVDASRSSADAVSGLNLPILSIDAQVFRYQKTIEISLAALLALYGSLALWPYLKRPAPRATASPAP